MHRNKGRMERSKVSHCTTLRVFWKWNYGRLKFTFEKVFCVLCMRNELYFIFDRLYLMTHVSSGTGKVSFFSVLIALACGVDNFVQEELFILTTFSS